MKYQHSETFNTLKSTRELIQGNPTSSQYLQTLDYLLWNALAPIAAECLSFFLGFISKCVAVQTLNPNTKYSSRNRNELPSLFFNIVTATNQTEIFELSKKLRLNRGLLFAMINSHQRTTEGYKELHSIFNKSSLTKRMNAIKRIEEAVGCHSSTRLYPAIDQIEYWDKKARWFKSLIVQKYTRMAMLQAQKTYVDFNHSVSLDDISQIYMLIVNKAIDRCDSRLGVLTTFIQGWLPTARSTVSKMASTQFDESYEALSEEGDSFAFSSDPDRSFEAIQEMSYLAYRIDPEGLVRASLGIPQYVTAQQRTILNKYANEL